MFFAEEVIVDSSMSFSEAVEGSAAPEEIILQLSLVDVLYYSFDGRKHQGQMLVHREVEDDVYDLFNFIEKVLFPVGKAVPIVAYQWNDHRSMADNNSSSFNYRVIEGTATLSLHALGKAVDINPLQNPVVYPNGVIAPDGARYDPAARGTFTAEHPVVQEFLRRGWHWGGRFDPLKDYHHFEKP
jgi:hypothetical protein